MLRAQSAAPPSESFSMEEMFKISTRQTSNFGIEGYEVTKKYADPLQQIEERKFLAQKKGIKQSQSGQKNRNHVTKRGHYLEDLKKLYEKLPAPNKYDIVKPWAEKKTDGRVRSAPQKRCTFIDDIFKEAKVRGNPGSGKYNVIPTLEEVLKQVEEQKKKKIHPVERPTYLNEIQFLAVINPGPGNYNPRVYFQLNQPIQRKMKLNDTKPADFITKHKEESKKRGKSNLPDIGTYNPEPVEFTTFNKISSLQKKREKSDKNSFGKEDRFKDPKKSKSKEIPVPGPGQYPMIAQWAGKEKDKNITKKKNFMDITTRGISKSIYY